MNGFIYALNRVSIRTLQKIAEESGASFCMENGLITDCFIEEEIPTQTANQSGDK